MIADAASEKRGNRVRSKSFLEDWSYCSILYNWKNILKRLINIRRFYFMDLRALKKKRWRTSLRWPWLLLMSRMRCRKMAWGPFCRWEGDIETPRWNSLIRAEAWYSSEILEERNVIGLRMLMSNKLGPRWRFPTIKEGKQIPIKAFYFLIQE